MLLDVQGSSILASRSSPSQAPAAFVLDVAGAVRASLTWQLPKQSGEGLLEDVEWTVERVKPPTGGGGTFDSLLVLSKAAKAAAVVEGKKMPLVLYPHGGPHSNQVSGALRTSS